MNELIDATSDVVNFVQIMESEMLAKRYTHAAGAVCFSSVLSFLYGTVNRHFAHVARERVVMLDHRLAHEPDDKVEDELIDAFFRKQSDKTKYVYSRFEIL